MTRVLGRKKGERFVREWVSLLASEGSVAMLFPSHPALSRSADARVQAEALAWLQQAMPALLSAIEPE